MIAKILRFGACRQISCVALICATLAWSVCSPLMASGLPALKISPIDPGSRGTCSHEEAKPTEHFDHVLTVVLENQDYDKAKGCLSDLVKTYGGRSFGKSWGLFHHSYTNYLAMVGGQLFPEVSKLNSDQKVDLAEPSIADTLTAKGLTWKNYAENYPGPCKDDTTLYAQRHVPFLSFVSVRKHGLQVVDAADFSHDVSRADFPRYAFYSPNKKNDGHDSSLATACGWVTKFLKGIPAERWNDTLVIVTFDEAAGDEASNNHIATVFLGKLVKNAPEEIQQPYNHYNVLRTIEDNFGLKPLADGDCAALPITGIWTKGDPNR